MANGDTTRPPSQSSSSFCRLHFVLKHRRNTQSAVINQMIVSPIGSFLLAGLLVLSLPLLSVDSHNPQQNLGFCGEQDDTVVQMATLGGVRDTKADIDSLSRFAVDEHNRKQNALLELVRVVKAEEQVVAGTLHHLTLEVVEAGKKKLYEAKVWVKPWMDFKELQEFKHVGDVPSFTSSDLGVKKDDQVSRWRSVPVHDPVVQDAAHHAVTTIQQRSNSLFPYELSEVIHANAEVVEASAKFDMLLKVKRGGKEEKFKVEVYRNEEGGFHLNKMDNTNEG
ncbi:Cysteine proteinase inhibitor 6 [Striga hermonthica]|uniref:Cysteine proteinase inhibitor n=1 Tax=Striga hermonthica TaxID=68872 RepID=A0A9N7N131_STRHE|nr:Cysteine proteinase inhibitor 6 [Striga hermonthica]